MPDLFQTTYWLKFHPVSRRFRQLCAIVSLTVGIAFLQPSAAMAKQPVDLELILAVDVSGSIDRGEAELQREGYMRALTSTDVINAIRSGPLGKVAMTYVEWAGMGHYNVVVDWQIVDSAESARDFVGKLDRMPFQNAHRTSLSDAIDYSVRHFTRNDFEGTRQIIDISGDGANNYGRLVVEARNDAIQKGIIINGLPILTNSRGGTYPPIADLDLFFRDCVIGGPGAFYVVAHGFEDFASAVRKKLILEIADTGTVPYRPFRADASNTTHLWRASGEARESPPCNVGEWRWMSIIQGGTSDR